MPPRPHSFGGKGPRHGLARALSKRGLASRTQAEVHIRAGRVKVNGRVVRDPEFPVDVVHDRLELGGENAAQQARVVVMLNKPRGLVTTLSDEQGRETVYRCFAPGALPWIAPVGRLDKASEGLLLFTNDPAWAAKITDGDPGPSKTYHVQIDCLPTEAQLAALTEGRRVEGEWLVAQAARLLRQGGKNAWLEIVLDEGRNRHIRRLLAALDIGVLRLLRTAIGDLPLGALAKGQWRPLTAEEIEGLVPGVKIRAAPRIG